MDGGREVIVHDIGQGFNVCDLYGIAQTPSGKK